jgi:DNA polymerase
MLKTKIVSCQKCPSLVKSRSQVVLGYGDLRADILFIGEAPGHKGADLTGIPFTKDKTGILFQEMLIKVGLSTETDPKNEKPKLINAFVTNIVKCNPRNNRTPTKKEVDSCSNFLSIEIKFINPKIIVPLGNSATGYILREEEIELGRYWGTFIKGKNHLIFPIYHPGYVVRGGGINRVTKKKYLKYFRKLVDKTATMKLSN